MEPPATGRPAGLSLERKLPLLITALLVATLAAGVAFGYRDFRRSSVRAAHERLELIPKQLSALAVDGITRRRATLTAAAADPAFPAFLAAPTPAARAAATPQAPSAADPELQARESAEQQNAEQRSNDQRANEPRPNEQPEAAPAEPAPEASPPVR